MLSPAPRVAQVRAPTAALLTALPQGAPPELITAIEDAVRDVLDRHGLSAFVMSRDAALAHEAGHAIVAAHEGLTIRSVTIFSQSVPNVGPVWGGLCMSTSGWTTGPATSADDDLRRARIIIAGLAGEAITGTDKPGSSLDEVCLSQLLGVNAALKLGADPGQKDEDGEYDAYAKKLWHEQVWKVALAILEANREPFLQIMQHLHQKERVQGARLRQALAQVRRIAP